MKCCLSLGTYDFHNHRSTFKTMYSNDQIKKLKEKHLAVFKDKHGVEARI